MKDLIERLEKATEPDRGLDADISAYIDMQTRRRGCRVTGNSKGIVQIGELGPSYESVRYTASIDAALTLVPNGKFWSITRGMDECGGPVGMAEHYSANVLEVPFSYEPRTWVSSTPAIALCIAALKARSAVTSPESK